MAQKLEKQKGDSFTLNGFTVQDAWELGHLLHVRLSPLLTPTMISISLPIAARLGSMARKRNTVLRFGCSTWYMHCKFAGDKEAFRSKYGLSPQQAGTYAIRGGAVPIHVPGFEGMVAWSW
ncbi:MAG: hypothetical protein M1816_001276 [Peltula sp. TS41687]|nr:MAG: hypothetical protein M1816_001276 [Peltula sp. TS41687]